MSKYIFDVQNATTSFRKSDMPKMLETIKEVIIKDPKWCRYGWSQSVLNMKALEDFAKLFDIQLVYLEDDNVTLKFDYVYDSDLFPDLVKAIAPYMKTGCLFINKNVTDTVIYFEKGHSYIYYGDKAISVYDYSIRKEA